MAGCELEQNQSRRALEESLKGGFFLRKKPLEGIASGYSYSGFALQLLEDLAEVERAGLAGQPFGGADCAQGEAAPAADVVAQL